MLEHVDIGFIELGDPENLGIVIGILTLSVPEYCDAGIGKHDSRMCEAVSPIDRARFEPHR